MTQRYHSKRKKRNSVNVQEGFIDNLLPGVNKVHKTKQEHWVKYLRLAIAIIRMAEYDYLSRSDPKTWKTAKVFLFGKDPLFLSVCKMLSINHNMAKLKLIAYRKAEKYGDPIFECISSEYADKYTIRLNPTSKDIKEVFNGK
jgi:hypothetical protein